MVKWSVAEPVLMKDGLDEVIREEVKKRLPPHRKFAGIISINVVKGRNGERVRVLYKALLPEDAVEYEFNRKVNGYVFIDDVNLVKVVKKALRGL